MENDNVIDGLYNIVTVALQSWCDKIRIIIQKVRYTGVSLKIHTKEFIISLQQ